MSTLYITEYEHLAVAAEGAIAVGKEPAVATQTVTVSGTSAASSAFNTRTKFVRLHTDGIISVLFGTAPTATTSHPRMASGQTEYFGVTPEGSLKVAAITNT